MNPYHLLRARWKLVTATVLAAGGLVVVIDAMSPQQYSSRVSFVAQRDVFDCYNPTPEAAMKAQAAYDASQLALVKSPGVLTNVIHHLKLDQVYGQREGRTELSMAGALEILKANLEVTRDPATQVITATVLDRDRHLAAAIANQFATDFRELREQPRRKKEQEGLATLKGQLKVLEADVVAAQARLDAMSFTIQIPVE